MDPVDQIRELIDEGAPDVLSRIATVLGFDVAAPIASDTARAPIGYTDAKTLERLKANPNSGYSVWGSPCEGYDIPLYAGPVATQAPTVVNLEGLRKKLLTPRNILRDGSGWLTHPDYPVCDEDTRADTFLEAFGIETQFVGMESDSPDLAERWHEEGLTDCSAWTPTPPAGDGWILLRIYDTEDGPYAMFGRDLYEAESARKKEHTRRLRDAMLARRSSPSTGEYQS